nr:hypothetical protein [Tanacetum cinerariifolium]
LKQDDDSEQQVSHEANDDMAYDPSDIAFIECGDDEVELMDKEFSDNEDEVAEFGTFRYYKLNACYSITSRIQAFSLLATGVRAMNMNRGFLSPGRRGRGVKEKEKQDMAAVNNRVKEASGSNEAPIVGKNILVYVNVAGQATVNTIEVLQW